MSSAVKPITLTIMDKDYVVGCTEEEHAALMASVEFLNTKLREQRESGKVIGNERVAVMAALNIANELLSIKIGSGFDIAELKRRMNLVQSKLDQALSQQDSLF